MMYDLNRQSRPKPPQGRPNQRVRPQIQDGWHPGPSSKERRHLYSLRWSSSISSGCFLSPLSCEAVCPAFVVLAAVLVVVLDPGDKNNLRAARRRLLNRVG